MKSVTIKLFRFAELAEAAQKKAAAGWLESNRDFYNETTSQFVTEDYQYQLSELGYPTDDIEWRLSYSQGDGMAFYGPIDFDGRLKIAYRLLGRALTVQEQDWLRDLGVKITRNSFSYHYAHYNTMDVDAEFYHDEDDQAGVEFCNHVLDLIRDEVQEVSRRLEAEGYKQFEGIDEAYAMEDLEGRDDLYFTADGTEWTGPDPDVSQTDTLKNKGATN